MEGGGSFLPGSAGLRARGCGLPCPGGPGSCMASSAELQPAPRSLPVERPASSAASCRPVPHGPRQGSVPRVPERQAMPATAPACAPDYIGAQVLAYLRGIATTPAPASTATWRAPARFSRAPPGGRAVGHLCPSSPPTQHRNITDYPGTHRGGAGSPRSSHTQTGTQLRARLQAFGLFFIVFDTTLFTQTGSAPKAA